MSIQLISAVSVLAAVAGFLASHPAGTAPFAAAGENASAAADTHLMQAAGATSRASAKASATAGASSTSSSRASSSSKASSDGKTGGCEVMTETRSEVERDGERHVDSDRKQARLDGPDCNLSRESQSEIRMGEDGREPSEGTDTKR